jgi:hypothetical protein
VSSALALFAYVFLLFYSQIHLALEAHEHGQEASHAEEHDHDSDHHHSPHPAADHSLTASTPCLGKAEQLLIHDLVTVAVLVIAPTQPELPVGSWNEDIPKHPPPRLPEQPRSPPVS